MNPYNQYADEELGDLYYQQQNQYKPRKLHRSKSRLTRPERSQSVARRPLVADNTTRIADNFHRQVEQVPYQNGGGPQYVSTLGRSGDGDQEDSYDQQLYEEQQMKQQQQMDQEKKRVYDWWIYLVTASTCCFPNIMIRKCFGKKDPVAMWAWREKMTLIFAILLACFVMGFVIVGLQATICLPTGNRAPINSPPFPDAWAIHGQWYVIQPNDMQRFHTASIGAINDFQSSGRPRDISVLFPRVPNTDACNGQTTGSVPQTKCSISGAPEHCHSYTASQLSGNLAGLGVSFEWSDVQKTDSNLLVYNGYVLDVSNYLQGGSEFLGPSAHKIIINGIGTDVTRNFLQDPSASEKVPCLVQLYQIGLVSKQSVGCFAANVINYIILVVIMGLVLVRFIMALIYSWVVAPALSAEPKGIPYVPPGVVIPKSVKSKMLTQPAGQDGRKSVIPFRQSRFTQLDESKRPITQMFKSSRMSLFPEDMDLSQIDLSIFACHVMILVTMYSENEDEIKKSLISIAETHYPDEQKLIFMVADGLITGGGQSKSTPEICKSLLTLREPEAQPKSYVAIADGSKQHNMAQVFYGTFDHDGRSVPTVLVVKCGTPAEANEPKPGNRGKRDSQIILMNFLSKVMFDDRMTELEYDLFTKIRSITGVYCDRFELVLMVDADTKIYPDSLPKMVNAMRNDTKLMGVCGETRLANPNASWVTMIQVYEYFISHYLVKNFESIFGGVSCLPGCFSMYRIKSPKGDGFWVPILANPDIIEEYSQNIVDTLHKKNLLLLGEDRFLSTLMLKTFPKRQMIFLPQAQCETVVPDKFRVLLSQRRRWINSTVHNLAELVFVKDLCGTFCISMQFVILMDLFGTVVLPAAIFFTFLLIYSIATPKNSFVKESLIPLMTLIVVLILPAVLIFFLTKRYYFVIYMFIYLLALPIWNFVLPVYSFWHFDDFGWGKTREVEGESKEDGANGHGGAAGQFDGRLIEMKRWQEWDQISKTGRPQADSGDGVPLAGERPRKAQTYNPMNPTYQYNKPLPKSMTARHTVMPLAQSSLQAQGSFPVSEQSQDQYEYNPGHLPLSVQRLQDGDGSNSTTSPTSPHRPERSSSRRRYTDNEIEMNRLDSREADYGVPPPIKGRVSLPTQQLYMEPVFEFGREGNNSSAYWAQQPSQHAQQQLQSQKAPQFASSEYSNLADPAAQEQQSSQRSKTARKQLKSSARPF
ncbi:hypothetical protein MP228_009996 [Amoeboaphelidium protococcarum]|nr:hypothetical protein MP228_009996 [Amoeboaphelidium protococcarum]